MKPTRILVTSIAVFVTTSLQAADTIGTFDGGGSTPATSQTIGTAPGPTIQAGGPTGSYLRLISAVNGQENHYTFDATHDGNWSTLAAQFDFRLENLSASPADGIGFLLSPQSQIGLTGNGITGFVAEEPSIPNTLAVGIDVYPNVNDVSLHWNGQEQTNVFTNTSQFNLMNSGWNRAAVVYTQVGNGLNASLQITKDLYGSPVFYTRIDQAVDARPYAARAQFSGRTGGLNMSADLDNITVSHLGSAAALPTINANGRIWQDFDSLGATGYTTRQHNPSDTVLKIGPKLVASGGSGGGAYVQLMPDGQNDTISSISFDRTRDGGIASTRSLRLDFRMANPDNVTPADGMGVLLLPTANFNVAGAGAAIAYENANVPGALGVGLRVYDGGLANRIQLHWNNAEIARLDIPTSTLNLISGEWHQLQLDTEAVTGGTNVSLSVIRDVNGVATSVPVFANHFVAGMTPYDYRVQTGARSGGLNVQADVDNIRTFAKASTYVEANNTVVQNFDSHGSFYQAVDRHGFDGGTDGTKHAAIVAGGPSGNFLRLAHAVNGQNPNVGFNQVIPNGAPKPVVESSFDFRMSGQVPPNERADGFAFGLFGVGTYGTSGGITNDFVAWESASLGNALTLGIRIHDGNGANSTDFLTLNWNGGTFFSGDTNSISGLWDLNNDVFHRAKLTLLDMGTDASATLTFTQDIFGASPTVLTVFSDVPIPGLDLDTFDFRAGFGARTGGLNTDVDLDNITVVPEPATAGLLMGALVCLAGRRRRFAAAD